MVYTKYNPNELIPKLKARLNLTEYNLNLIGIRGKMGKRYRYPDTMIVYGQQKNSNIVTIRRLKCYQFKKV